MADSQQRRYPDPLPHDDAAGLHGPRDYYPGGHGLGGGIIRIMRTPATWVFLVALFAAWYVGKHVQPTWVVEQVALETRIDSEGRPYAVYEGDRVYTEDAVPLEESPIRPEEIERLNREGGEPEVREQVAVTEVAVNAETETAFYELSIAQHWRFWSLLPALVAIVLCWITREPVTSLFGGIVVGAFLLGRYDITEEVLMPILATPDAVGILLIYMWLLGGLLGLWSRTGAAEAFARMMSRHFVRGPRTAKLTAWILGIVFFQGSTVSAVLVGTTVKPLADEHKVSSEELSYVVDSTSSPIAGFLAFNAWPGYIQAFLFIPGVAFLATETDRVAFFFKSLPLSFYCIFAVIGTFLFSIDKMPLIGQKFRDAIKRSRTTGELTAPGAHPLSSKELQVSSVPAGYTPHVIDFFLPLGTLIAIAVVTFGITGSPQVRWAFGAAVLLAMFLAVLRGMTIQDTVGGFAEGMKGIILGLMILLLAIVVGNVSREAGGAMYLVELLGEWLPFFLLPVILLILTIVIAFSTGTSWGTYAVTFPLSMPLAWEVAHAQDMSNPMLFLMVCFAAVLNGSIYGDQCSPISDTTVLSSMSTGADLMDHVKTQIVPATCMAALAAVCWTVVAFIAA